MEKMISPFLDTIWLLEYLGESPGDKGPTYLTLSPVYLARFSICAYDELSVWMTRSQNKTSIMPFLNVLPLDDAVDVSCFGKAWELTADPPVISASTLEAGFLCDNPAACTVRLANNNLSGLGPSFTLSKSFDVGPYSSVPRRKKQKNMQIQ